MCVCVYDLFVCYVVTSIRLVVDTGGRNTKKIYVSSLYFSLIPFSARNPIESRRFGSHARTHRFAYPDRVTQLAGSY
jgi:hypothetical protein